jgi:hypothetical protein
MRDAFRGYPSTYLRIIKVLFRHTLSSQKNIFQELNEIYGKWNNFHQNDSGIVYF